jgi:hypothetical protein
MTLPVANSIAATNLKELYGYAGMCNYCMDRVFLWAILSDIF